MPSRPRPRRVALGLQLLLRSRWVIEHCFIDAPPHRVARTSSTAMDAFLIDKRYLLRDR